MNKIFYIILCLCLLILLPQTSGATHLYFEPSDSDILTGDQISIDLRISELGRYNLNTFSIFMEYDSSVLQYISYSLHTDLYPHGDEYLKDYFINTSAGYLSESFLHLGGFYIFPEFSWQADNFSIATLTFRGCSEGIGKIGLSDIAYNELLFLNPATNRLEDISDITEASGYITVSAPFNSTVPEPGTVVLLGFGLLACAGFYRKTIFRSE